MSAASRSSGGPFRRGHRHADAELQRLDGVEGVEVGRVVARVERALEPALAEQVGDRRPLVRSDRRPQLQHLPSEARHEALVPGARRRRLEHRERLCLVLGAPVVERDRQRLALDVVPVDRLGERVQALAPLGRLGYELEAVLADVDELVEPDDAARIRSGAAADAGDERVPLVQPRHLGARLLRHDGFVRNVDDRRQHSVDVEQDRGAVGGLGEPGQQGVGLHRP